MSEIDLELQDGLAIDEVTTEAFTILGANGIVRVADGHTCSECTHEYKATADIIANPDSTATIDDLNIPQPSAQQEQSSSSSTNTSGGESEEMQIDKALVKLVVLDGLVTGPSVC
jgi:hypothetical protein